MDGGVPMTNPGVAQPGHTRQGIREFRIVEGSTHRRFLLLDSTLRNFALEFHRDLPATSTVVMTDVSCETFAYFVEWLVYCEMTAGARGIRDIHWTSARVIINLNAFANTHGISKLYYHTFVCACMLICKTLAKDVRPPHFTKVFYPYNRRSTEIRAFMDAEDVRLLYSNTKPFSRLRHVVISSFIAENNDSANWLFYPDDFVRDVLVVLMKWRVEPRAQQIAVGWIRRTLEEAVMLDEM